MEYGPFDAAGITRVLSINVSVTRVLVDGTDEITVVTPPHIECDVRVENGTLRIEGPRGGGDIMGGITIQAGFISGAGSDQLVRVMVPRQYAHCISTSNVAN